MKYYKTRKVKSPERAHDNDSGIDFFIPEDLGFITTDGHKLNPLSGILDGKDIYHIPPLSNVKIPLGVKVKIPKGFDFQFVNKSSVASTSGLVVGASLVDNGYTGELILNLINTSDDLVMIKSGMKIVQGVVRPVEYTKVEEIFEEPFETDGRGDRGFGSTGD